MKTALIWACLLFAGTAIAGPKTNEVAPGIIEIKDVPLQRSVYKPAKISGVKAKDGWRGNVEFKVYPYITKSFDGKQTSFGLVIDTWGRADVGACWMLIMADGAELFNGQVLGQYTQGLLDNRGWRFDANSKEFPQFENVDRKIAASTETWLTIGCSSNTPERRSVKLSADQIAAFHAVITFSDSATSQK